MAVKKVWLFLIISGSAIAQYDLLTKTQKDYAIFLVHQIKKNYRETLQIIKTELNKSTDFKLKLIGTSLKPEDLAANALGINGLLTASPETVEQFKSYLLSMLQLPEKLPLPEKQTIFLQLDDGSVVELEGHIKFDKYDLMFECKIIDVLTPPEVASEWVN